jgi:hypothetical protein
VDILFQGGSYIGLPSGITTMSSLAIAAVYGSHSVCSGSKYERSSVTLRDMPRQAESYVKN